MLEDVDISKKSTQIYNYFNHFYNYEKIFKEKKESNYKGYLIDLDLIIEFKKNILYERLLTYSQNNNDDILSFEKVKNIIEKECENKKIERNIVQIQFDEANDLIRALEEKKFYLLNEDLWKEICNEEKKGEESGISFILDNKKVSLTFKQNDKLDFEIKDDCILEKSRLIQYSENIIMNQYYDFMIEIYLSKKKQNQNYINSINEKIELKNSLVQKEWMRKFLDFYEFEIITSIINNSNNKNQKDSLKKELKERFPKNSMNKLINKRKNKEFNYLNNEENFFPKLENFEICGETLYYYNNCEIIDEAIFNKIKAEFSFTMKYQESHFLIEEKKIIMELILKQPKIQYSLLIFSIDENKKFEILLDILIYFKETKYIDNYFRIFNRNGIWKL